MRPEPRLTPGARGDIFVAAAEYNDQRPELGYDFLDEVEKVLSIIRESPLIHTLVDDPRSRAALIRRFPYGVFCIPGNESDLVLAVLDLRQDPLVINTRTTSAGDDLVGAG